MMPTPAQPPTSSAAPDATPRAGGAAALLPYLAAGVVFGIVLTKGEVISWFRIQEMFRFQGWHMFGIFATALPVATLSAQWLTRSSVRGRSGEPIVLRGRPWDGSVRYVGGGVLFGMGWALTGACPGPLFALLGSGVGPIAVVLVSALAGTWTYGALRPRLPH